MDFNTLMMNVAKIVLPSAATFFALACMEKRDGISALRIALKVLIIFASATLLNFIFSPKILGSSIVVGQRMNFTGQSALFAFGVVYAIFRGKRYVDEIGLLKFEPLRIFAWALFIGFVVLAIGWVEDLLSHPPIQPNINYFQKFIFEATLPGLGEEVLFRGILLEIANSYFRKRWHIFGVPVGFGLLAVSIPFGFAHIVSGHEMSGTLMLARFISTGSSALALGWLKEKTGSLPACAVAHNVANSLGTLVDFLALK